LLLITAIGIGHGHRKAEYDLFFTSKKLKYWVKGTTKTVYFIATISVSPNLPHNIPHDHLPLQAIVCRYNCDYQYSLL